MSMDTTTYRLTQEEADELSGLACVSDEFRVAALEIYLKRHGSDALIRLFSQFVGMANSVVANNREMIEMLLITEGDQHPYSAEKANLPTLLGAATGAKLANGIDQEKTCQGCAYRLGTPANQCLPTTIDAEWCASEREHDFLCHETDGPPSKICRGFAQATKRGAAA